jgi:hypothetical protein
MKKIAKVTIKHLTDDNPDTSWMGEYSDTPKSEYAIEREYAGYREYRYFNPPVENYDGATKKEIKKYCQQDYERMEGLNNGNWQFIGIRADAEIHVQQFGNNWLIQHITSGGLWGIESDCGRDNIEETEQEQLADLATTLKEFGFSDGEIAEAIEEAEHDE